jgi:hypothetical protein
MTETREKVFTFQPTSSDGKPMGSLVEIAYTSDSDLQQQMIAACQRMKFAIRSDKVKAPATAERFNGEPDIPPDEEQIRRDVATFLKETPGYYSCPSNIQAILKWAEQNDLTPTLENLRLAYRTLSANGLLLDATGRPTSSADTTGISYMDRSGKTFYGKQAIEAMPSEVYKRRFNNEDGFREKVEKVLAGR